MMIYPQGNYITTSEDTPFLQIGESKYGKPILDRILTPKTTLESAAVCALVSMDSTMRSNITVGPPLELLIYRKDSLRLDERVRLTEDHSYLRELKKSWDSLIKQAFQQLPPIAWATARDPSADTRNATFS
jgi:putative proteasome-type protease